MAAVVVSVASSAVQRSASGSSGARACVPGRLRVGGVDRVGHERPVARDAHVEPDGRPPLHADRFADDLQRLPHAAELGEAAGRIERLAVEIFDVGRHVGRAPGDEAVASQHDGGPAGQRGADDVERARGHVREIPERGQLRAKMRVVGEQRLAAGGARAVHHPVVGTERFGRGAAEQQVGDGGLAARQALSERVRPDGPSTLCPYT